LKNAGVTPEQFAKMTTRQRLDLKLPRRDWRKGWMGNADTPSHLGMRTSRLLSQAGTGYAGSGEEEDKEVTIARAEREKAGQPRPVPGERDKMIIASASSIFFLVPNWHVVRLRFLHGE
jgi:hypothetical protein